MEESAAGEQAVTPASLQDRIAQRFHPSQPDEPELSSEPEPEQPDEGSDPEPETPEVLFEEVEYEGKTYQVPTEIKNGLMSRSDYTRKTQELARNRENMELQQKQIHEFQEQQRFEQTLQEDIGQIGSLNYQLKQYEGLDWSKMESGDRLNHFMNMERLEKQRKALNDGIQEKRQKFAHEQQTRVQELLQKATESLQKGIPGWGEAMAAEVSEYALAQGYTQHEVNNIYNPRDVTVLWKAQQYDKLVSSKGQALKKASKAPPVVKPGSVKPMPQDVRDKLDFRKQMKKTSSSQERARLIQQKIAKRFERESSKR